MSTDEPFTLADRLLALDASTLDEVEALRIATENRFRALTRSEEDKDGETRGLGFTIDHPDVLQRALMVMRLKCDSEAIPNAIRDTVHTLLDPNREPDQPRRKTAGCCMEHDAERNLRNRLRQNPLYPWLAAQKGVGDKQVARLLAAIGDPYIRPELVRKADDDTVTIEPTRPRTVSELWALCGYRPGQRREKGKRANWSADAKSRADLVAKKCGLQLVKPCYSIKDSKGAYLKAVHLDGCACSPYRVIYDEGRAKYRDSLHPADCVRCGPKSKPALIGTPRSAAHQQQMAYRLVTKALLKDLWREAKRIHEGGED